MKLLNRLNERVWFALWLAVTMLLIGVYAHGQDAMQFKIADASSSGTYKKMLSEIADVCNNDQFQIVEGTNKGGATDNLNALATNQVSAAFLHSDVIYAKAQADPNYRQLKTLIALYPEEIHVLSLRVSKARGTGFNMWKSVTFNSVDDLKGWKVGAAGGGVITSRILTGQGEGHFDVVEFGSGDEVIHALNNGDIQAAVFVGGSPLPNLTGLSADTYKLLPISEGMASRLSGVYNPATIEYLNLKSGPIKTLAPTAILLTRKYTSPKFMAPQAELRRCFYSHLTELKETPGNHPKWQQVDENNHGTWEWYDLPTIANFTLKPQHPITRNR